MKTEAFDNAILETKVKIGKVILNNLHHWLIVSPNDVDKQHIKKRIEEIKLQYNIK